MVNIIDIKDDRTSFYDFRLSANGSYTGLCMNLYEHYRIPMPSVYNYQMTRYASVSTDEFYDLKSRFSKNTYTDNLLPVAVRYVHHDNIYVIERPPFQIEVDYKQANSAYAGEKIHPVKIWIPWTVTILALDSLHESDFSSVQIFFNDGPLQSLDDLLVPVILPNAYADGKICFAQSMSNYNEILDEDLIKKADIGYIYNYIFNNYMMGGWNADLNNSFFRITAVNSVSANLKKYPTISRYLHPTQEQKNQILDSFPDKVQKTKVKRLLNKKNAVGNFTKNNDQYVYHFATMSTFSLEDTLNLVSEIKQAVSSMSTFRHYYNVLPLSEVLNRRSERSSPTLTSFVNSIINSDCLTPQYDMNSSKGYIIIDFEHSHHTSTYSRPYFNSLISTPFVMSKIHHLLIDSMDQERSHSFAPVLHVKLREDGHQEPEILDISLSEALEPYIQNLRSSVDAATPQLKNKILTAHPVVAADIAHAYFSTNL